jgi:hypothetical protein
VAGCSEAYRPLVLAQCAAGVAVATPLTSRWWCRMIWDKHATPLGIVALMVCLLGGCFYKQAPMRAAKAKSPRSAKEVRSTKSSGVHDPRLSAVLDVEPPDKELTCCCVALGSPVSNPLLYAPPSQMAPLGR